MKYLNILLLTIFCFTISFAQNITFTDLQSMPEPRSAITSAADQNNVYICNGFTSTEAYSSEVLKYNFLTNTWSTLSDQTVAKRFASSVIVNNKLYILGGLTANGVNTEMEVIDLITGTLSTSSAPSYPTKGGGTAVWDNKIYYFGGSLSENNYNNLLTRFDTETEEWQLISQTPLAYETKGEIIDGKLYVIGGYNGDVSNRIDAYDIATNSWELVQEMPVGVSAHTTTTIGSKIWIIGDYNYLDFIASFDTADNTFQVESSDMVNRRHAAAESLDNNLFLFGGNQTSAISSSISNVQFSEVISNLEIIPNPESLLTFPNPATTEIRFNLELENIKIFDYSGKLVKERSKKTKRMNIRSLEAGPYILLGEKDGVQYKATFIKLVERV